jgi:hypothetical protein
MRAISTIISGVTIALLYQLSDRGLWTLIAAFCVLAVLVSGFADHRRSKRNDINDVGFMPWTAITVFAVMAALLATALAIKSI